MIAFMIISYVAWQDNDKSFKLLFNFNLASSTSSAWHGIENVSTTDGETDRHAVDGTRH